MTTFLYWLQFNVWLANQAFCFACLIAFCEMPPEPSKPKAVIIYIAAFFMVWAWALTRPWVIHSTQPDWLRLLKIVSIAGRGWDKAGRTVREDQERNTFLNWFTDDF